MKNIIKILPVLILLLLLLLSGSQQGCQGCQAAQTGSGSGGTKQIDLVGSTGGGGTGVIYTAITSTTHSFSASPNQDIVYKFVCFNSSGCQVQSTSNIKITSTNTKATYDLPDGGSVELVGINGNTTWYIFDNKQHIIAN